MKGLLIKDIYLLKNQKQVFVIGIFVSCIFALTTDNIAFGYMYMSILFSMASVTTISLDQNTGGMNFLLTLPVSRSSYTKEKYLLMLITTGITWIATLLLMLAAFFVNRVPLGAETVFEVLLTNTVSILTIHALIIPLELKFEAGKSRSVMLLLIGIFYLFIFACTYLAKHYKIDVFGFLQDLLSKAEPGIMALAGGILAAGLMGISFLISLQIMKKKEF